MANRLASESSPYLLQHKDNPVDWYPWGDEAFAKAKAEDKPVFLSVGYSSCHWCHVMEHESFEHDGVAAVLNDSFICVKVDREERPDVDEAYMAAVQLSSGRGGWPMSVFLTPDKKPFFAGTYFPRENRGQQAGFLTICSQIAAIWKTKRAELEENATEFALGLGSAMGREAPTAEGRLDEEFLANAVKALAVEFDNKHGGFGGAPKFPPHTSIDFLLRYAQRESAPEELREVAIGMAIGTLERMSVGGIHDHVGGGFHRYSTDDHWLLPHFEKMLYDNALMLGNYAIGSALLAGLEEEGGQGLASHFAKTAQGILVWLFVEMTTPEGLFCSALDADSEGEEGRFYVWTLDELKEILGDRADAFAKAFQVEARGNFEDEATGRRNGANVLHLDERIPDTFQADIIRLRGARAARVRPQLDDKALTNWNGLMIGALSQAGIVESAEAAAAQFLDAEEKLGFLPHQIVGGVANGLAYLDDYAALSSGLFSLATACDVLFPEEPQRPWRAAAKRLTARMIELFWDEKGSGFFGTSDKHEELFGRSKPVFDSPTPSGNALALRCLVENGDLERANRLVAAFLGWMEKAPQATEALLAAALPLVTEVLPASAVVEIERPTPAEVSVVLKSKEIKADPHGFGQGEVVISIPAGFHINGNDPPARWLVPTKLEVQPLKAEVSYPEVTNNVYEDEVRILFTLNLPEGSSGEEFEVKVSYQACTESECLAPQEKTFSGVLLR